MHERSGGVDPGRDGCRVPLPWSGATGRRSASARRATAAAAAPRWLPQPASWHGLSVQAQPRDPDSTLSLYRSALRLRREHPDLGDGTLRWLTARGDGRRRRAGVPPRPVAGLRDEPAPGTGRPAGRHDRVLLSSAPLEGGRLPADTTVWLDARTT